MVEVISRYGGAASTSLDEDYSFCESEATSTPHLRVSGTTAFWASKRIFDVLAALGVLPLVGLMTVALIALNPRLNPGPVFFLQRRMGRGGIPFTAVKFRTMSPSDHIGRGPEDPVESWRITRLGGWLRRTRLDELPQFLNVLRGEMSVIGPRPDYIEHARHFAAIVPGYRERHLVRPGISGLAQVKLGYAEGVSFTSQKTALDHEYIRGAGWRMDTSIIRSTLIVMATGFGAR
jgi:lipopolysaccharide/colanic/teichoic acid biosynthesis glycosyltransferase